MAYNIADLFEHAVDYFPDRLAVACGDDEVTYAELEEQANRLAHHLAEHGVTAGSHVGMCTRNRLQSIVTMLAVYKLRAALINVNYRYTANEIRYVLENADVVALVHERMYSDRVAEALPGAPTVQHTVVIEDETELPFTGTAYDEALAEQPSGARLRRAQRRRPLPALHRRHDRHAQGRHLAARGRLAHARRRHQLRHRRAARERVRPGRDWAR